MKNNRLLFGILVFCGIAISNAGCAAQDESHVRTIVVGGGLLSAPSITLGGAFAVFSPDGTIMATGSNYTSPEEKRPIQLRRVRDGSLQCTLAMDAQDLIGVTAIAFDPSGRTLATGHWYGIKGWRISDGALLKEITSDFGAAIDLSFSPDGKTLASCHSAGILVLWDTESGHIVRTQWPPSMVEGRFRKAKFAPDGKTLVTGTENGQIQILRVSDGAQVRTIGTNDLEMWSLVMAQNGRTLATTHVDGSIRIWRVSDGTLLSTISTDSSMVCSLALDPAGEILAVGFVYLEWRMEASKIFDVLLDKRDYSVKLYRASDGTLLHSLRGHKWDVTSVKFSPDGTTLASGSMDMSD
jgi:WD40 repeat protein